MATEITQAQHDEGYWVGPLSEGGITDKVYNTTLATLTLEVYYRFLPTYKMVDIAAPDEGEDNDIRVEIVDSTSKT